MNIHKVVLCSSFLVKLDRGKPEYLEKNLLKQRGEPTTNYSAGQNKANNEM